MEEFDPVAFEALAREVYRRKFGQVAPRATIDALVGEFYFGPPGSKVSESPSTAIVLRNDVGIWIDGKLNEYGFNPNLAGPPIPTGGVQADDGNVPSNLEAGLEERYGSSGSTSAATGLPAWAWGAIAAALVLAGWSFAGKRRRAA